MKKLLAVNSALADFSKIASLGVVAVFLSACGGTGQDDGSPSQFEQNFSGRAIDGYVARATVYIDTNNDGRRNAWEPFAFTDNEGYYSNNPNTGVDYCADTATSEQQQYCLRSETHYSNMVIRIDSGYDVSTGEPFMGQMSRRLENNTTDDVSNTIISPLTTMMTEISDQSDRQKVLNSMGVSESDLDVDYFNTDGNGQVNSNLLNTAVKVHKTVAILSDRLTDTYDEIGQELGTPSDASGTVYKQLANQLISGGSSLDETLSDQNQLASVLDNAENTLRSIYERKEIDLPNDMGSVSSPESFSRVIDQVGKVANVVNNLVNKEGDGQNVTGSLRALESIVIKAVNEKTEDSTFDNAVNFLTDTNNQSLIDSLTNALASDSADIATLSQNDFSGDDFDSVEEIEAVTKLPQDALPFTQIGGLQVRVSDLDLGQAPDDLKDREIEWYFSGTADSLDGEFSACVKYIDEANIDGSLGDGNTRGEIVHGFWSLLGANSESIESYSLLLTISYLETTYQAIMKPAGGETIGDQRYQKIRFDFDGDVRAWHSVNGLVQQEDIPTTDAECQARLPSRIGI